MRKISINQSTAVLSFAISLEINTQKMKAKRAGKKMRTPIILHPPDEETVMMLRNSGDPSFLRDDGKGEIAPS